MKKAILILVVLVAVVGCKPKNNGESDDNYDKFVADMKVEGVFLNGNPILTFNEDSHQFAVNAIRKSCRIQTDDAKLYVMMVQQSDLSSVGQEGALGVTALGLPIDNASYDVKVVKAEGGKVWLWSGATKTGFVMSKL